MHYSWRQRANKGTATANLSRFVVITALLAATGFALFVSVSSSAVGSGSVLEPTEVKGETERVHSRRAERAAAVRRTHEALAFAAPFIGTITVDRTDDTAALAASLCTAAPNDCSLRGAIDFANSSPATTINVPAGNYNLTIAGAGEFFAGNNSIGDLDITGNNTSIIGAGAAVTIITQTTGGSRVIEVNPFLVPGIITSISGVTVSGGTETAGIGGGGILSGSGNGSLTISNSVISGNSATGVGSFGGGGLCHTGGSLTINGSTFSTNSTNTSGGGVSYSASDGSNGATGILTVSGSTFTSNTANSSAAGGGALDLYDFNASSGVYTINSSSFSSNTAPNGSGGAIIVESGGPLTVTTSSFAANSAGNSGGAIFSSGTVVTVMYSRLVGNSASSGRALFRSSGTFTANDDWWGINSGPSPGDFSSPSGNVIPITWLQLRASGNPNAICDGGTSNITADIKQRNAGAPLTVELNGLPPFPAMFVNATPAVGSLSAVSANFVNGEASATFTASAQGTALIDVVGDNQTVTATVIVGGNTTTDPADQMVCEGGTATFTTTASGPGPFTFAWKKGATVLNNGDLGGRATITSLGNSSTLSISNAQTGDADTYTVEATGSCSTATQTATLTINQATSTTDPADATVCQGATASFSTTASGTGPFSYAWTLDGSPFNGNSPSINVPTGSLSIGNHTVVVTTTGACSASQSATLTVSGPPVITLSTNDISLWPPNHKYRTFNVSDFVASASGCEGNLTSSVVIASVSSDELEDNPGGGDGNTLNDIVIAANCKSVQLRAERDGNLNGRVYTITFRVTDSQGNTTTATATVSVPHNANSTAVNGPGPGHTVTSACP